jgi:hypothetical protein
MDNTVTETELEQEIDNILQTVNLSDIRKGLASVPKVALTALCRSYAASELKAMASDEITINAMLALISAAREEGKREMRELIERKAFAYTCEQGTEYIVLVSDITALSAPVEGEKK